MGLPVKLAVVGAGRIGRIHAMHAQELAGEQRCDFAALVDTDLDRARATAFGLPGNGAGIAVFKTVDQLLASCVSNAAVVCTSTANHRESASALVHAGHRVLLEKPLTSSLEQDRSFTAQLNRDYPDRLMLAFQRRFDKPLLHARELLRQGIIGAPFKTVSVLEDSASPASGYNSPGLLLDMAVHNVDEILWLTGETPTAAAAIGSRLFSHRHSPVEEDFDDAFLQIWFASGGTAQVQVSRNHVAGYRNETWIHGEKGVIHVGHFTDRKHEVSVEAYAYGRLLDYKSFLMRDYGEGQPEFVDRFGPAYKSELAHFLTCCERNETFGVNQNDGLRAMEVIAAGMRCAFTKETASPLC